MIRTDLPLLLHVYPQFRSEDDFLDMDYHQMKSCRAFAHRYRATVIGG